MHMLMYPTHTLTSRNTYHIYHTQMRAHYTHMLCTPHTPHHIYYTHMCTYTNMHARTHTTPHIAHTTLKCMHISHTCNAHHTYYTHVHTHIHAHTHTHARTHARTNTHTFALPDFKLANETVTCLNLVSLLVCGWQNKWPSSWEKQIVTFLSEKAEKTDDIFIRWDMVMRYVQSFVTCLTELLRWVMFMAFVLLVLVTLVEWYWYSDTENYTWYK